MRTENISYSVLSALRGSTLTFGHGTAKLGSKTFHKVIIYTLTIALAYLTLSLNVFVLVRQANLAMGVPTEVSYGGIILAIVLTLFAVLFIRGLFLNFSRSGVENVGLIWLLIVNGINYFMPADTLSGVMHGFVANMVNAAWLTFLIVVPVANYVLYEPLKLSKQYKTRASLEVEVRTYQICIDVLKTIGYTALTWVLELLALQISIALALITAPIIVPLRTIQLMRGKFLTDEEKRCRLYFGNLITFISILGTNYFLALHVTDYWWEILSKSSLYLSEGSMAWVESMALVLVSDLLFTAFIYFTNRDGVIDKLQYEKSGALGKSKWGRYVW